MNEWIKCADSLPCLDGLPDWNCGITVIAATRYGVFPLRFESNKYAKTEKGMTPRWVDMNGRIAGEPEHWMPMPVKPEK